MPDASRFSPQTFQGRRSRLSTLVGDVPILLMGHTQLPRNYPQNPLPFRQDSTLLYFTGCRVPGVALLMDEGKSVLYLPEGDEDDELWHGPTPSPRERAEEAGVDEVRSVSLLARDVARRREAGRSPLSVPIADPVAQRHQSALLGEEIVPRSVSPQHQPLADGVIALRSFKDEAELAEMVATAEVTRRAHRQGMAMTQPRGMRERHVGARMDGLFAASGCVPAYGSIVTVRGEVLHCHSQDNLLLPGQLLLVDAGAESREGYATDVTRTWPVSGRFTDRQKEVYRAVLAAQLHSISMVRPGVRYRDIHFAACRIMTEALVDLGLLRGDPDRLVEDGVHAAFFPHGVGHLIGLDVHDMEGLGHPAEYAPGRLRSQQFGLAYLRLDRDLAPGMVVTIEPGLYFVPAILRNPRFRALWGDKVNYSAAEEWLDFGGIRIEDDVACTEGDPWVLTGGIPKEIHEVEALVGSGPPSFLE